MRRDRRMRRDRAGEDRRGHHEGDHDEPGERRAIGGEGLPEFAARPRRGREQRFAELGRAGGGGEREAHGSAGMADPRVDEAVQEIDGEINRHHRAADEERAAL